MNRGGSPFLFLWYSYKTLPILSIISPKPIKHEKTSISVNGGFVTLRIFCEYNTNQTKVESK